MSFLSQLITAFVGSAREGQVRAMPEPDCSSSVRPHLKNINLTKAENTYENGGGWSGSGGVLGYLAGL